MKGKFVLIRTYGAGVHYGTLISRTGQEVHLSNARRIWNWNGALSLSEVAMQGVDIPKSKISVPVDEIILTQAMEIILISKDAKLPK